MTRTAANVLSDLRSRTTARDVGTYACIPLLEGDQMLMRLAVAWRKVRPAGFDVDVELPDALATRDVRWLWSLIEPDPIPRWIEVAGLPFAAHTIKACYVLIDNEAALPDGNLSLVVEQYIRGKVGAFMSSMMPRRAQAIPPPPPPPEPQPTEPQPNAVPAPAGP